MDIKEHIRTIPDWPKEGIMFRDITTLLQNPEAFRFVCNELTKRYQDEKIDAVVGIEARGFIFGSVLAYNLGCSFIPVRKPSKLPSKTISEEYALEYGKNTIEIHEDALKENQNILIVDDLLATGGTLEAAIKLVERLKGNVVECAIVIELPELKGREKLGDHKVFKLIDF
ncbi:MAG: adenine phosphoribosyltransferase [Nanoarchaeota archaeon]|nr:adenine phosphoribosyltransferase [Nanoarchaeota archaeon]